MDRLTEQWFKTTIKNIKTKLEEKKIKTKITEAIQCLQEMGTVHCKKEDGYKIIVTVGSTIGNDKKSKGSKKEHNPSHAHVWSIDHKFYSRFQIVSETPPKTAEDLKKVEEDDMDFGKYSDKIVEWANKKPVRSASENDKTNWDAMRTTWRDIQDVVNEGLKEPQYI